MKCPKCENKELEIFEIEGVEFDFCCTKGGCLGLWCEKGELALYTESGKDFPFPSVNKGESGHSCPKCLDKPLFTIQYEEGEDLELDFCEECEGIFVDSKELRSIEKAIVKIPLKERLANLKKELINKGFKAWS